MKKTLMIILGSALVSGVAIKAAPAFSQTLSAAADTNVAVVRTADLDLSTRAGQRWLDRRLASAAAEVCGEASNVDLKGSNEARRCREGVLAAARARASELASSGGQRDILVAAKQ